MTDPAPDALDRHDASRVAAHGTVLRLVSYGASLLISVLAIRLLTTHLGTGFGTYTVVSTIAFVAVGSADAGLSTLGLREGANVSRQAAPRPAREPPRPAHRALHRRHRRGRAVHGGHRPLVDDRLRRRRRRRRHHDRHAAAGRRPAPPARPAKRDRRDARARQGRRTGGDLCRARVSRCRPAHVLLRAGDRRRRARGGDDPGRPPRPVPPALRSRRVGKDAARRAALRVRGSGRAALLPCHADHDGVRGERAGDERVRARLPHRRGAERDPRPRRLDGAAADRALAQRRAGTSATARQCPRADGAARRHRACDDDRSRRPHRDPGDRRRGRFAFRSRCSACSRSPWRSRSRS